MHGVIVTDRGCRSEVADGDDWKSLRLQKLYLSQAALERLGLSIFTEHYYVSFMYESKALPLVYEWKA
jgi:hypothetical protein